MISGNALEDDKFKYTGHFASIRDMIVEGKAFGPATEEAKKDKDCRHPVDKIRITKPKQDVVVIYNHSDQFKIIESISQSLLNGYLSASDQDKALLRGEIVEETNGYSYNSYIRCVSGVYIDGTVYDTAAQSGESRVMLRLIGENTRIYLNNKYHIETFLQIISAVRAGYQA